MAFSSVLTNTDMFISDQYNNLRKDVLDPTGGHSHLGGTDQGKKLSGAVIGGNIDFGGYSAPGFGERISRLVNNGALRLDGAIDWSYGAHIALYGRDHPTIPGYADIVFGACVSASITSLLRFRFDENYVLTVRMTLDKNGQLSLPATGSTGGLLIGGDTTLYRAAADLLKTDDNLVVGAGGGQRALTFYDATVGAKWSCRIGDSTLTLQKETTLDVYENVFNFRSDYCLHLMKDTAQLLLGAAGDVNLYRSAADILMTDDHFKIADGKELRWSDVNLYRSAANVIKTDDSLDIVALRIGGTEVITASRALVNLANVPMQKIEPAVVRWVIPGWFFTSVVNYIGIAGRIHYIPIYVSKTTTYIRVGCYVQTASAGSADFRIYNWSGGLPSSLVLNPGSTVDTGTTGLKEITISQQLTPGFYFLAIRNTGTPALYGPDEEWSVVPPVSGCRQTLTAPSMVIMSVDAVYADPAPTPTGVSFVGTAMAYLREN